MLTEKTFGHDGISLNYVEGPPSGVPLVMLHGLTTCWQVFLPVMPGLMARYQTFALDLRGHGNSSWHPGSYVLSNDVADVVALLRDRVKRPAVLLGWSLGALVALMAAVQEPELVQALVLADPPLWEFTKEHEFKPIYHQYFSALHNIATMEGSTAQKRAAFAAMNATLNELLIHKRFAHLLHFDPDGLTSNLEGKRYEGQRLEELLPKIKCSVLVIQGNPALGGALDHATWELARPLIEDCVHVYLPEVGHGVHDTNPPEFFKMVSDFLESL